VERSTTPGASRGGQRTWFPQPHEPRRGDRPSIAPPGLKSVIAARRPPGVALRSSPGYDRSPLRGYTPSLAGLTATRPHRYRIRGAVPSEFPLRVLFTSFVSLTLLIPPGMCRCQLVGGWCNYTPTQPTRVSDAEPHTPKCSCESCRRAADRDRAVPTDTPAKPAQAPDGPNCPVLRTADDVTYTEARNGPVVAAEQGARVAEAVPPAVTYSPGRLTRTGPPVPIRLVLHKFLI
jgi:hypothetical protein